MRRAEHEDHEAPHRRRRAARVAAALTYVPIGLLHVRRPEIFLPIMPPPIPYPRQVVIATGIAEIAGGLGLLRPRTRKAAAVGLALYAVAVYPANVYHAAARKRVPPLPDSWWYHGPRLAFQPVFVWWALFAGGPWRRPTLRNVPRCRRRAMERRRGTRDFRS